MLLEFSCSNYKSINEKVVFSFIATSDSSCKDYIIKFDENNNVLKTSVIYGSNGSGKSNFLETIAFVRNLVVNSINYQPGMGINQQPHKLAGYSKDSDYLMQFEKNGIRFVFGFTLNKTLISREFLYFFPNKRRRKIYERQGEKISYGENYNKKFDACKEVLKPNRLFLTCAAYFSKAEEIEQVYKFFLDDIVVYGNVKYQSQNKWLDYSLHKIYEDKKIKEQVIKFFRNLDIHVEDILIKIEKRNVSPIDLPPFLSDEVKKILIQNSTEIITTKIDYGNNIIIDLFNEESEGIKKLFGFICPFLDVISNNKILICDEPESNLHESIIVELLKLFKSIKINSKAQFLFTTHDTSLLDADLFRRDQIWFTELRKEKHSTDLYSLAEIKNVRKDEKYSKGYINGKYGAVPLFSKNIETFMENND